MKISDYLLNFIVGYEHPNHTFVEYYDLARFYDVEEFTNYIKKLLKQGSVIEAIYFRNNKKTLFAIRKSDGFLLNENTDENLISLTISKLCYIIENNCNRKQYYTMFNENDTN